MARSDKGFLEPKVSVGDLGKRRMDDGIFRNPPTYTSLGGFTSASKVEAGKGMSIERGGPSAQKGKPI